MQAQSLQSCLILCNPMDCSLPGSSVHGILQKRIMEWVVIPFSRGSSQPTWSSWTMSPALQADSLPLSHWGEAHDIPCLWNLKINDTKELTKQKQTHRLRKSESRSVMSNSVWPQGLEPTRLLCPWNSPGKNTGVGCHSLLQGIFLTQELNLGLLNSRQILCHLSYRRTPQT